MRLESPGEGAIVRLRDHGYESEGVVGPDHALNVFKAHEYGLIIESCEDDSIYVGIEVFDGVLRITLGPDAEVVNIKKGIGMTIDAGRISDGADARRAYDKEDE